MGLNNIQRRRINIARKSAIKLLKHKGIYFDNAPNNFDLAIKLAELLDLDKTEIRKNKKYLQSFFLDCLEKKILKSKSEESKLFLRSHEWKQLRYQALKRYGNRCMACGATPDSGAILHVDHIKPRSKFPELALNIENLQILCADCNWAKLDIDSTDWRNLSSSSKDISMLRNIPKCPDCGAEMVLREPKNTNKWKAFWGCSKYFETGCNGKTS